MLYDWTSTAALGVVRDIQPKEPLTLTGEGLWVCLVSSGRCTASLPGASAAPAGSVLVLPPQSAAAGHLILSRAPLTLTPEDSCHLLCVQLTGQASTQFLNGLRELPYLAKGETCPAAAELMGRLAEEKPTHSRARSQLVFALLCELADADSAAPALPPLVQAAIEDIRANYAGLYGVEELSERLGVSKSHLVRTFTAAVGVPPGKYLTTVRIEAAQRLLLLGSGTVLVLAAVLYAAVFGLTDPFVSWFNSENSVQMAQYAHTGMRMYFVGYFFAGFNIMAAGYLSAVNRPAEASITSICRGMVAIVACSLVLSAVFGMPGVWAAFPASELLTALLTLFLLRRKESGKA